MMILVLKGYWKLIQQSVFGKYNNVKAWESHPRNWSLFNNATSEVTILKDFTNIMETIYYNETVHTAVQQKVPHWKIIIMHNRLVAKRQLVKPIKSENEFKPTLNEYLQSNPLQKTIFKFISVYGRDGNKTIIVLVTLPTTSFAFFHKATYRKAKCENWSWIDALSLIITTLPLWRKCVTNIVRPHMGDLVPHWILGKSLNGI